MSVCIKIHRFLGQKGSDHHYEKSAAKKAKKHENSKSSNLCTTKKRSVGQKNCSFMLVLAEALDYAG
jgi:hypothetical protein